MLDLDLDIYLDLDLDLYLDLDLDLYNGSKSSVETPFESQ